MAKLYTIEMSRLHYRRESLSNAYAYLNTFSHKKVPIVSLRKLPGTPTQNHLFPSTLDKGDKEKEQVNGRNEELRRNYEVTDPHGQSIFASSSGQDTQGITDQDRRNVPPPLPPRKYEDVDLHGQSIILLSSGLDKHDTNQGRRNVPPPLPPRKYEDVDPHGDSVLIQGSNGPPPRQLTDEGKGGNTEQSPAKRDDGGKHGGADLEDCSERAKRGSGLKHTSTLPHLDMGDHVVIYPEHYEESESDTYASYTPADSGGDQVGDAPGGFCQKVRDHAVELWNKMKSTDALWWILGCGLLVVASGFIAEGLSPGSLIPGRNIQDGLLIGKTLEKPNNPWWTASYKENSSAVAYPTPPAPPTSSGTTWQTGFYEMMNNSVVVSLTTLPPLSGWKWTDDPHVDVTR